MFLSLSIILILGVLLHFALKFIKLPPLIGYLILGIVIGPFVLDAIDISILSISTQIRQIALIIILIRAGISLNLADLRRIGRPALLLCFLPALFEIALVVSIAPLLFDISYVDSLVLGSVLAAVSPAVIVPRMIKLMDKGIGTDKGIPQMIMAGASVDDVFVIILFSSFLTIANGDGATVMTYLNIPLSIILGLGFGIVVGILLGLIFKHTNIPSVMKLIIVLGTAFGLKTIEMLLEPYVACSSLLATMSLGIVLLSFHKPSADQLKPQLDSLWQIAEIFLFVLVGASVDITILADNLGLGIALVTCGIIVRMIAVFICTIRTKLNAKERLYSAISYTPKATVQAAIGGLPLAAGLLSGGLILSIAVISILLTAPLGAIAMDLTYKPLLLVKNPDNDIVPDIDDLPNLALDIEDAN